MSYFAGLFDGEGCVFVAENNRGYKGKHVVYHALMIHLSNTDPRIIQWIKATFGGGTCVSKPGTGGKRMVWIWWAKSQKASRLLKLMLPYLKIKKDQAELALAMQATMKTDGGSRRTPQNVIDFRVECRKKISALNHRTFEQPERVPNSGTGI